LAIAFSEARHRRRAELELRESNRRLHEANQELEAFAHSVAHDLRAPLRAIDGFGQALVEDCSHALDRSGHGYLARIRDNTQRMGRLIDEVLQLSRLGRVALRVEALNLSSMAKDIVARLRSAEPSRAVDFVAPAEVPARGDVRLLAIVLENLLSNGWKFTGRESHARIELGISGSPDERVYFVRDNGAGFDPAYASKLFGTFARLHNEREFPGIGVGLATVQRIVRRHDGRVWADGIPDVGATFYFTLGTDVAD
jgi:light-regulated signal transduction histidine kinase (bacteriophytochrome)